MIIIQISCEEVIEEYADLVYRIALSQTKHRQDAEDIFQDVFLSLMKNLDKIKDSRHLKFWLIRATVNRSKNYHLCFWKQRVDFDNELHKQATAETLDIAPEIQAVRHEIGLLPAKLRAVVYLYYYEEYSVEEIGEILRIPGGTVKSRLYSARSLLKNKMKEVSL